MCVVTHKISTLQNLSHFLLRGGSSFVLADSSSLKTLTFSAHVMTEMYELAQPFYDSVAIVLDERMGRCLVACRDFEPGQCIFEEDALVYASYRKLSEGESFVSPEMEVMITEAYKTTTKRIMPQMPNLLKSLAKLPKIASLDTARCLIQLIAISSTVNVGSIDTFKMKMLSQLSAANLEACLNDVKLFRKKHPKWLPKTMKDAQVANLLGILNTNQMELDELGGSGLFVVAAITEHNCSPNSSFTTSGSRVFMAAIRPIKSGERISIDYSNGFYQDQAGRIDSLKRTYDFVCNCESCISPDSRRKFMCEHCGTGSICPPPYRVDQLDDRVIEQKWSCLQCSIEMSSEKCESLVEYENSWMDTEFESLDHILSRRNEQIMHQSHYLVFWALSDITSQYLECGNYIEAKRGMLETIALLDDCVQGFHHEKVLYLDKLGQIAVRLGEHELAKNSFRRAYEMSIGACGVSTPITLKQKDMYENTPLTVEDLMTRYPTNNEEEDDQDEQDDEMEDEWI